MPTSSGRKTIYDVLDSHLGENWDRDERFGRLLDLSFTRLLEIYIELNTARFGPTSRYPADQLVLYLGEELELKAILCAVLHSHKVALDYPIRSYFYKDFPGAIKDFATIVQGLRDTPYHDSPESDPFVEMDRDLGIYPRPTKNSLRQLLLEDYLPKLAPLRYLVENELLEFVERPWELLPHRGRYALRGCVETSYEFCNELYAVLRAIDPSMPLVAPRGDWWGGPWDAVRDDLNKHWTLLQEVIMGKLTVDHRGGTLLYVTDIPYRITQLLMAYFDEVTDMAALIGHAVQPKLGASEGDRVVLKRFLEQKLLAEWTSFEGLSVATVIDIRRSEEEFEFWLAELSRMLPVIKASPDLAECEAAISDLQESLRRKEAAIVAKLGRLQSKGLKDAVRAGIGSAELSFLGGLALGLSLRDSLIVGGLNGLATIGGTMPMFGDVRHCLTGADLILGKLAIGKRAGM